MLLENFMRSSWARLQSFSIIFSSRWDSSQREPYLLACFCVTPITGKTKLRSNAPCFVYPLPESNLEIPWKKTFHVLTKTNSSKRKNLAVLHVKSHGKFSSVISASGWMDACVEISKAKASLFSSFSLGKFFYYSLSNLLLIHIHSWMGFFKDDVHANTQKDFINFTADRSSQSVPWKHIMRAYM